MYNRTIETDSTHKSFRDFKVNIKRFLKMKKNSSQVIKLRDLFPLDASMHTWTVPDRFMECKTIHAKLVYI